MSKEKYLVTREIGIDMGHRVPHHGSKCKSMHGHRYKIIATCEGKLIEDGEQQGMILDFGFLKDEMMKTIDYLCDHGTVLYNRDELVNLSYPEVPEIPYSVHCNLTDSVAEEGNGVYSDNCRFLPYGICKSGKLVIVPFIPTAENLARWWFNLLAPSVKKRSEGNAVLVELKVWETPNCSAVYPSRRI